MAEGIDYASPGVSPSSIVAAGKTFVGRYLSDHAGDPYGLTASEAAGLLGAGLDLVLLWEINADRAAGGAPTGTADGLAALAQLTTLGAPADATVYFVCQDDGTPPALASIDAYLNGAASALRRDVGCYAGGTVLAHVKSAGSARYLWRAAATSWGPAPVGTHIIQYATGSTSPPAPPIDGHAVDLDRATVADFGQWRAAGVAGVRVKQAATVSTTAPWASFGTAKTAKACKSNDTGTGAQHDFPAGADLGVVQLGTLVAALGSWPAGTPIVLTNVNGEQSAFIKAEVAFTPMTPPVAPAPPTKTVTVTGQNVTVVGPK